MMETRDFSFSENGKYKIITKIMENGKMFSPASIFVL